jgi:ribonuclease P protein component
VQRDMRLRRRQDFNAVHRRGRSWANSTLVVRVLPNALPQTRVGFSISKRVGKAVVRNRIKRRLREVVRALAPRGGHDLVVIAREPAADADYQALRASLESLLQRAHLLGGAGLSPHPSPPRGGERPRRGPERGEDV